MHDIVCASWRLVLTLQFIGDFPPRHCSDRDLLQSQYGGGQTAAGWEDAGHWHGPRDWWRIRCTSARLRWRPTLLAAFLEQVLSASIWGQQCSEQYPSTQRSLQETKQVSIWEEDEAQTQEAKRVRSHPGVSWHPLEDLPKAVWAYENDGMRTTPLNMGQCSADILMQAGLGMDTRPWMIYTARSEWWSTGNTGSHLDVSPNGSRLFESLKEDWLTNEPKALTERCKIKVTYQHCVWS